MRFFAQATGQLGTNQATLASGRKTNPVLDPIPQYFWRHQLHQEFDGLGNKPAVGGPHGFRDPSPNGRIMECFGSTDYQFPFTPTSSQINGVKGRIMKGGVPADNKRLDTQVQKAIDKDNEPETDILLSMIHDVSLAAEDLRNHD